ncbi:LPS export ABC transporter ATP-binding protein [bacterium]|nr:LPS export ABC transporter ATP-binding protein [bacterium]
MVLEVENLEVKIGKRRIVKNLSFSIKTGSIVGLLGANGAGKTTTFLALIGLIKPAKGTIYLDEEDITKLPMYKRARKGIGYLSQEPSIFKELTVEENLLAYLDTKKLSKQEKDAIIQQHLAELHITSLKKKRAGELSGGERRRVEIARALTTNPKILFLDEPFANIDPKTIEDVKKLIFFLKERGITIFITDHNAYELLSFIDKGLFLHKGELLASGTKEELLDNQALITHYLGDAHRRIRESSTS